MFKRNLIAASILLAMAGAGHAADAIQFDYNGGAAGGSLTGVTTFDWQPGNAIAINGNPSGGLAVGDTVTVLYQANLGTITDGSNILFANGTNSNWFTGVATFNETVTSVGANGTATFALAAGTNQFQIFHNTAGVGNSLTGEGFKAGNQILLGSILSLASGNFQVSSTTPVLLDQFNSAPFAGDNLGGQQTVTGSGATDINIQALIANVDTSYFTDLFAGSMLALSFFNTSLVTPFLQVQPSNCFLDGDAAGTNNGCNNGGYAPNLGTVNGALQTIADRDFQFQADGNESFTKVAVPEPASLALVGLGLFAVGWSTKRKGKGKQA